MNATSIGRFAPRHNIQSASCEQHGDNPGCTGNQPRQGEGAGDAEEMLSSQPATKKAPTRRERAERILHQARDAWLQHHENVTDGWFYWMCKRCGSDLERMYLAAVFFMEIGGGDVYAGPVGEIIPRSLTIEPQKQVGPYTVDFAFSVVADCWFTGQAPVFVAVECDGEYFHDRTSKQVERDRARDRYLNMRGWRVLRFSEREIVKDVHRCAAETKQFIENLMHEQVRNDLREPAAE